jgi:P-type Cu+ transporter
MMNQLLKSVLGSHYQHVQHLWRRTKTTHTDPVCGMSVTEPPAGGTSEYHGRTYRFCSRGCKAKFDANPARYAQEAQEAT